MPENKIAYKSLFKIGIWKTIPFEINLKLWIDIIYNFKKNFPNSQSRSSQGGYQSSNNLQTIPTFYPLIKILNKYYFKIIDNPNKKLTSLWINVSSFSNYNTLHTHNSCNLTLQEEDLSGVLYLKVPSNSGALCFTNPYDINHYEKYNPVEGDLIFFNKSLPHMVEPNLSQEDRISIAFNYG